MTLVPSLRKALVDVNAQGRLYTRRLQILIMVTVRLRRMESIFVLFLTQAPVRIKKRNLHPMVSFCLTRPVRYISNDEGKLFLASHAFQIFFSINNSKFFYYIYIKTFLNFWK